MDIEKLIEQLRTESLYADKASLEIMDLCMDAAQTLESLQSELEKVKAERDAAVEYLRGQCRYCKRDLVCTGRKGPHSNCWEWRGPQKEE